MPQDLSVGRPFIFHDANGAAWELGVAVYPNMSQEFCDDWWIKYHAEAAVIARGELLIQWRDLLALDPADGTYKPIGMKPAPIFLSPAINPEYAQGILPGWPPLFIADLEAFPLDNPNFNVFDNPNFITAPRYYGDPMHHAQPITRLMPGDPSPPVIRTSPPMDRSGENKNDPRFIAPTPALYPYLTPPPAPRPPPVPGMTPLEEMQRLYGPGWLQRAQS
jgi:hypothetical protein